MKKELIICIFVISIVIIGNIVTQNYTKQCVATMNKELVKLKEKVEQEEKNDKEIENKIDQIEITWDDMQERLAFYIEHDELEKVETQISLLKGQIEAKSYADTFPEMEKCIFILEHIEDKTALNIKNIF